MGNICDHKNYSLTAASAVRIILPPSEKIGSFLYVHVNQLRKYIYSIRKTQISSEYMHDLLIHCISVHILLNIHVRVLGLPIHVHVHLFIE